MALSGNPLNPANPNPLDSAATEQTKREAEAKRRKQIDAANAYARQRMDVNKFYDFQRIDDPDNPPVALTSTTLGIKSAALDKPTEDGLYMAKSRQKGRDKFNVLIRVKNGQATMVSTPESSWSGRVMGRSIPAWQVALGVSVASALFPATPFLISLFPHFFSAAFMGSDRTAIKEADAQLMDFSASKLGITEFKLSFNNPYGPQGAISSKPENKKFVIDAVIKRIDDAIALAKERNVALSVDDHALEYIRLRGGPALVIEYQKKLAELAKAEAKHNLSGIGRDQVFEGFVKELKSQQKVDQQFSAAIAAGATQQDAIKHSIMHVDGDPAKPLKPGSEQLDALLKEQSKLDGRLEVLEAALKDLESHIDKVKAIVKDDDVDGVSVQALRDAAEQNRKDLISELKAERADILIRQDGLLQTAEQLHKDLTRDAANPPPAGLAAKGLLDKLNQAKLFTPQPAGQPPVAQDPSLNMHKNMADLAAGGPMQARIDTAETKDMKRKKKVDQKADQDRNSPKFKRN